MHQVIREDNDTAAPLFQRAADLARGLDDRPTLAYALRHLGIVAHMAGDLETAKTRLTESTELRRQLGHQPGVAANLVGLAYVASAEGRASDASELLGEADLLARSAGAHGVLRWINQAQADLTA